MTDNETWEEVRKFYVEKFGTAPELVDIAPVLDILRLCASGSSNKSIAKFCDLYENELESLFDAYLGFMGWSTDLSFSPLKIYKELNSPDEDKFKHTVILRYNYLITHDLERMYESARLVERLERLFDEKWI